MFVFYPCVSLLLSFSDDHSRVILSLTENDPESHYINANYIDVSGIIAFGIGSVIVSSC